MLRKNYALGEVGSDRQVKGQAIEVSNVGVKLTEGKRYKEGQVKISRKNEAQGQVRSG